MVGGSGSCAAGSAALAKAAALDVLVNDTAVGTFGCVRAEIITALF